MTDRRLLAGLVALLLLVPFSLVMASGDADEDKDKLIGDRARDFVRTKAHVNIGPEAAGFAPPCLGLPTSPTPHDGDSGNDDGWILVDFCTAGATGSGSAQAPDCHHNDDDSASQALAFTFDLYGDSFTSTFINNNGNLSFDNLFSTFTSSGFPVAGFPMVAPFWGDVDTGHPGTEQLGHVWYQPIGANTLAVGWDHVGYYNEHGDLLNTFQMLISDGTNASMGLGNNVCFCYEDMQWTTGDASSGVGGFGGTPATVGANRGDGVDFFQIGRFDHEGVDYDGPFGATDGVSFLDGQNLCFNATGLNIPPIPVGFPFGDTVALNCGETLDLDVSFLSPEGGQTTTVVVSDPSGAQAAGLSITNTPGNTATLELDWVTDAADAGIWNLTFTASDDFSPPGETVQPLAIDIACAPTCTDDDGDGYGSPASSSCTHPEEDCDDSRIGVNPGATEICDNQLDDDCDGIVDNPVDCDPLLVVLDSFTADAARGGVLVRWTTLLEVDNIGFRVLRRLDGEEEPVVLTTQLIMARGSDLQGAEYVFRDETAPRRGIGAHYYLEDIDLRGQITRHGPVETIVNRSGRGGRYQRQPRN